MTATANCNRKQRDLKKNNNNNHTALYDLGRKHADHSLYPDI